MSHYRILTTAGKTSLIAALTPALAALLAFTISGQVAVASLPRIVGSGTKMIEDRDTEEFRKIRIYGSIDATITYGEKFSVAVSGDDNIVPLVHADVHSNGALVIGLDTRNTMEFKIPVRVMITSPRLEKAKISGSSRLSIDEFDLKELTVKLDGSSSLTLESHVDHIDIDVGGSSLLTAENASAKTVEVEASGASKVVVSASESIDGKATGSSTIVYGGDAKDVTIDSSSTSKVRKAAY